MELFISGFLLSLSLCLDLGIVNVAIMRAGVERGLLPATLIGLGSGIGDLIYAVLSMVGISFLLENVYIRWFLWIGGTVILLYMTYQMFRSALKTREVVLSNGETRRMQSPAKDFLAGISLALASPSAILFFASIGGSIIATATNRSSESLLMFFSGFFLAGLLWSVFMGIVSSQGGKLLGSKLVRGFSFLSAGLFLFFAAKVFWDGYQKLL